MSLLKPLNNFVMSSSFDYQSFLKTGKLKEKEFADLLVLNEGGTVTYSNYNTDTRDHIDIFWTKNDKTVSFDVKGLKKNNRSDDTIDSDIHWIEIANVKGNLGWLYGKADYIAFETLEDWMIVRRVDIIDLVNLKVINKSISKSKDFYTLYQRYGRQDIIVKVPTSDLRRITKKVFKKITNEKDL